MKSTFYLLILLGTAVSLPGFGFGTNAYFQQVQDTTKKDTTEQYTPTRRPVFDPSDRYGDPFSNQPAQTPFLLRSPSTLSLEVEIDTSLNYTIYEKIGPLNYRPATNMSFEEYMEYQDRKVLKDYWKEKSAGLDGESAVSGRNLIPPIYVSPIFDRIFGGSYVEIIPRGFVTLDFGANWQRLDNPNISTRMQRSGGFEFDEQISMNIVGKVGEKLAITANYDNNSSFDFENNLKVEYTGFKEDILKKLEVGNVSLPLNNSLMTGGQNLFGIKTQMQFGDLYVTSIATTQRGKSESIEIEGGGGQGRPFELIASNYDENRHFFLGHFFRNNYERWLAGIPFVSSGVNITRVEVYIVNRNNDTETLRNVVGLMDLGEPNANDIHNSAVTPSNNATSNSNDANSLWNLIRSVPTRDADVINQELEKLSLENGTDFEKITGARKLTQNEYTINPELGYISLFRKLQNDEALAVAYEYTYQGASKKVGELSEDYSGRSEDEVIYLKLLRQRKIPVDRQGNSLPTWDLMMKNIYNLQASSVTRENFQLRVIYRDDKTGIDNPQLQEGVNARNEQLLQLMGLDRLNSNNDRQRDGNFDFIEGVTIDPETGLIIFPVLKPFEDPLRQVFNDDPNQDELVDKYVYNELYDLTLSDAQQVAVKNKYFLVGTFQAGFANEINIPGWNISPGSVRVFAGGAPLIEGRDFHVDYNFGKIKILNQGILNSGKKITITYEKADLFNFNSRTLVGTRLDYQIDEDINLGATLLHLNERRLISRVSLGNEPTKNTKYGFDVNIRKDSRVITKALDFLPFLQTKEQSAINFNAEFAQLLPGTSNIVDGEGTSYIDDFESVATPFNLGNPKSWAFAATPKTNDNRFIVSGASTSEGYKRAKLAWYQIDAPIFYHKNKKPDNIPDEITNHYVRPISPQEVFPDQDREQVNLNEPIFDLAYYPNERGIYNYNPSFSSSNPQNNWAGITNAITNEVDFDKANIEYIEFWMMDPFIASSNGVIDDGRPNPAPNTTGGELIFNLGSISEDFIPDGRHGFENGLPADGNYIPGDNIISTDWGYTTNEQFLTDAFDNSSAARANQDVGLDGADDALEKTIPQFAAYHNTPDPSADNFEHYLSHPMDSMNAGILRRYKNYNGLERNSPISSDSRFLESGSSNPDNEDLNNDNTLSEVEEYYEYSVALKPSDLQVGKGYVVDKVSNNIHGDEVTWYLFRIPIRDGKKFGNITGFKSIRFIRMYMTNFSQPAVLRMANFRFVSSKWRKYEKALEQSGVIEHPEPNNLKNFTVSVVSREENNQGNERQPGYVLPPGISSDRDNTSVVERRLNEQSLQLCVDDLTDGDSRAVFRDFTPSLDMINFGRIKMFLHANSINAENGELSAIVRMGSDQESNYYEIEIPLTITSPSAVTPGEVWPSENEIDLALKELIALKSERDRLNIDKSLVYPAEGPKVVRHHLIRVKGNPNVSEITRFMIGIKNPRSADGRALSACIWANELRVTEFDKTAGWAANATLNLKLADFATITASGSKSTVGFGGIQERISERDREDRTSYDISANVALDKLLPEEAGLQIPMFVSYEKNIEKPKFDPANPDIELEASLLSIEDQEERDEYRDMVVDQSTRRSVNFMNVKKIKTNPDARKHIYDIENFSFSYSYNDRERSNFNVIGIYEQNILGSVAYNYSPENQPWEPFREWESLKSPYLKLIKDFNINLIPSSIAVRGDVNRQFRRTIYRNENNANDDPVYEKFFNFARTYSIRWALSQGLSLDYDSRALAIIDEPEGEITEDAQDSIMTNLKNLGRMKDFNQNVAANYRLPLDKLPLTDWISGDVRYQASFRWIAGPAGDNDLTDSLNFGSIIQNSRNRTISTKLDLVKLYNKSKYLSSVNRPARPSRPSRTRTATNEKEEEEVKPPNKTLNSFMRFLMMVRSVNANYSVQEATTLPGFNRRPYLFGLDSGQVAPGIPFLLGSQSTDIKRKATDPNDPWLIRNENLTSPFTQDKTIDIGVRANLEPINEFKVQLDAKKSSTTGYREILRYDASGEFVSENPSRGGSYTVSYLMINTAFSGNKDVSPVFQEFEKNIEIIRNRLDNANQEITAYDTAQDVLIPAFVAAYSGKDVNNTSLSPFPKLPLPNWRVDYSGLTKLPVFKDKLQSITISHSYKSSYTVGNYMSSLLYHEGITLDHEIEDYNDERFPYVVDDGRVVPIYIVNQVVLSEQFAPLIGISVRTKDRFTAKVDYNTKRDIGLNISNSQVTEISSNDVSFEVGVTKNNFKLPFKHQGRVITLENDLTFRMNFTIRNTKTLQRKIGEEDKPTNGNYNFQLRPNINYVVNDKLNLQIYFERNTNEPVVSTSYPRSNTQFGVQLRFSLAQ